jgi:hypothetical protein
VQYSTAHCSIVQRSAHLIIQGIEYVTHTSYHNHIHDSKKHINNYDNNYSHKSIVLTSSHRKWAPDPGHLTPFSRGAVREQMAHCFSPTQYRIDRVQIQIRGEERRDEEEVEEDEEEEVEER